MKIIKTNHNSKLIKFQNVFKEITQIMKIIKINNNNNNNKKKIFLIKFILSQIHLLFKKQKNNLEK